MRNASEARSRTTAPISTMGRVPPHDLDAEAAVLSAVMLDTSALDRVLEFLRPEHFYSEAHRRIFEACVELHAVGKPVDLVQVGTWLKDRDRIQQVGGMGYVTEVIGAGMVPAHVGDYGRTIREKARVRQLIATCQRVAAEGYTDYGEAQTFIDGAEQSVYEIARTPESSSVEPVGSVIKAAFRRIVEASSRGERVTGIPTGFARYDKLTAGLHAGDLSIVAARPGMGKTSFVLNVAVNVASPRAHGRVVEAGEEGQEPGYGCAVFSLEMPREQLANRMMCSEGRVDVARLREGYLGPSDWERLTRSATFLAGLPIWIDDAPSLSILELRAKVRRLQAEYARPSKESAGRPGRVGLVVVDYLQLMRGRENATSREQEISEISRGLKALAKELKIAVVALSQLNRAVETRGEKNKRPQLSDLRESGAIEQDADNICFLYRDDYYTREESPEPNVAELIIAKQRNGPTGTVKVRFTRECTRFDDLAAGEHGDDGDA
jgi:replicative DNA helicase